MQNEIVKLSIILFANLLQHLFLEYIYFENNVQDIWTVEYLKIIF